MPIDIEALTEPELIDLNPRIVARLRFQVYSGDMGTVHPAADPAEGFYEKVHWSYSCCAFSGLLDLQELRFARSMQNEAA
jgi:hypothetical protein